MKIAIVGATGLVGKTMLSVIKHRNFQYSDLILAASERSKGQQMEFDGQKHDIIGIEEALDSKPHIALFSAGSEVSKKWAPQFASIGCTVIDNSSCWRMHLSVPLIVPEINGIVLTEEDHIIANPNCSTIQVVAALAPLHQEYKIKRLVISTYQSVSGSGIQGIEQLQGEQKGIKPKKVYPHRIHENIIPHGGNFLNNGYTEEEQKLIDETRKIFGDDRIKVSPTVARVPVIGGHSASVNVKFKTTPDIEHSKGLISSFPGLVLQDDPTTNTYPMPLLVQGKDEVFVGRIRKDPSSKKSLNLWIVADNLRKGAATNAVQIAEYLVLNNLIKS